MAKGFMSGFGPAFADAFNAGNARHAQEEQDNFQMMYKAYIDKKAKLDEEDKLNSTNIKKAKSLAADYTGSEQNWQPIYRMLAAGRDDSEIVDFLKENDMEIAPAEEQGV